MNTDMTYCSNTSCLHRVGCKRSLDNYSIPEKILLSVFDGEECSNPKYLDDKYQFLIRFRPSNGGNLDEREC